MNEYEKILVDINVSKSHECGRVARDAVHTVVDREIITFRDRQTRATIFQDTLNNMNLQINTLALLPFNQEKPFNW